jgi:hypothetical protein
MGALFNSISGAIQPGGWNLPGAPQPASPTALPPRTVPNLGTGAGQVNPSALDAYLNQVRQQAAMMQAMGRQTTPFQNALNAYGAVSGTLPPPATIRPAPSPEAGVAAPLPGQMPAPSPLLQQNNKLGLFRAIGRLISGAGA